MNLEKHSLEKLKQLRKGQRVRETVILQDIESELSKDSPDIIALQASINLLNGIASHITNLTDHIQYKIDDENDLCSDCTDSLDRERKRERILQSAQSYIAKANSKSEDGSPSRSSRSSRAGGVKLPTLSLTTFDGNPLNYQGFWDVFRSAVHENPDVCKVQKFNYLKGILKGEALQLISGFRPTDVSYDDAINLLQETYGKTYVIVRAHIHSILDLSSPKANASELRSFMANYECDLRSLESYGMDVEHAGYLYSAILLRKLPNNIRDRINRQAKQADSWDLPKLRHAIQNEIQLLADSQPETTSSPTNKPDTKKPKAYENKSSFKSGGTISNFNVQTNSKEKKKGCPMCQGYHRAWECSTYPNVESRLKAISNKSLCYNCLGSHAVRNCGSHFNCYNCGGRHNSCICRQSFRKSESKVHSDVNKSIQNEATKSTLENASVNNVKISGSKAALPTAMLSIKTKYGVGLERALFDQGSQMSFISEVARKRLKLEPNKRTKVAIQGFDSTRESETYDVVSVSILTKNKVESIEALVVDCLPTTVNMPGISQTIGKLNKCRLQLADPHIDSDSLEISIIIGGDSYFKFVQQFRSFDGINLLEGSLGSMVTGPLSTSVSSSELGVGFISIFKCCVDHELNDLVSNLWDLESIGISIDKPKDEELKAMENFKNSISFNNGQYTTRLPWKRNHPPLQTNYSLALGRLNSTLKKLRHNPDHLKFYDDVISDQLSRDFIEEVSSQETTPNRVSYLPHLPVWRADSATTPLRVVYDASAGSVSLNDCLSSGPSLNHDMVKILLRFRLHKYAVITDISKAYLRISLHPDDRDVTRFLWPANPEDSNSLIKVFRFKVVIFGATCSQFLLNATIQHHLAHFPGKVADSIKRNIYVDNLLATSDSESELVEFYNESKSILHSANFPLREWESNSSNLNSLISENKDGLVDQLKPSKILGMRWNSRDGDVLFYPGIPDSRCEPSILNKRKVLSDTMKLFDPLGFLCSIFIKARIFFQKLNVLSLDWDTPLDDQLAKEWISIWMDCIQAFKEAKLYRSLGNFQNVDMHVFVDASANAYAAIVYFCENSISKFVIARARVAPKKVLTIPKLELTAALIGTRLAKYVMDAYSYELNFSNVHMWSDSLVTLCWIKSNKKLETYVHNRVSQIRENLPNAIWHHVPTVENVADIPTKGMTWDKFKNFNRWEAGPSWLSDQTQWPEFDMGSVMLNHIAPDSMEHIYESPAPIYDLTRVSKLDKLLRITAIAIKFTRICRKRSFNFLELIRCSLEYWVLQIQREYFPDVLAYLTNAKVKPSKCPNIIKQLQLFMSNGVIRCRGRLENSLLTWEANNPILISAEHHFSKLLIEQNHIILHHMGVSSVVNALRQRFWMPSMRQKVKNIISKCVPCRKLQAKSYTRPIEPPLPKSRLEEAPAFTVTGIDYSGVLYICENSKKTKVYLALFTCAVSRAIHLDLVRDNSCYSFLQCFKRFIGRRSCPSVVLSDNSTTFVSAASQLKKFYRERSFQEFMASKNCEWRFSTPKAPFQGGIWERLIGVVKSCLKKSIGPRLLTYDELYTLLVEIEATVNDRPITAISSGDTDIALPLTPSQLMHGHRLTTLPTVEIDNDINFNENFSLFKRQKNIEQIKINFWNKWRNEYLLALRERPYSPHSATPKEPQVGEVVLVHDETKRQNWKLAKILHLIRGKDGYCRSARILTQNGELSRPIVKLYPLEVRSQDNSENPRNFESDAPIPRPARKAKDIAKIKLSQAFA